MPKQKNNIVMRNTQGMLGGQVVFKRRAGKAYVAAPPEVKDGRIPTAGQRAVQDRFTRSARYAKAAIKDRETKLAYEAVAERGQSAFNVALADAYNPPQIQGIIAQGYAGQAGNVVVVQAIDDFRVNAVRVSIHNSANELIESGDAVANADGLNWTYIVTQANPNIAGTKITATAIDLPGNEGSLEAAL